MKVFRFFCAKIKFFTQSVKSTAEKIFQTFFQKPLDKCKLFAIIKVQKERTQQKMLLSFNKARGKYR